MPDATDFHETHGWAELQAGAAVSLQRSPGGAELASGATFGGWAAGVMHGLVDTLTPGAECLAQASTYAERPTPGDRLTFTATVAGPIESQRPLTVECTATDQRGRRVISSTFTLRAPRAASASSLRRTSDLGTPDVVFHAHGYYRSLLERCQGRPPLPAAVVWPIDHPALVAAGEAAAAGLVEPILVGPGAVIARAASEAGVDVSHWSIIEAPTDGAAATAAAGLVRAGAARLLMKGSLHTNTLLRAVLSREAGIREDPWISHVFLFDVPAYPKPLLLSDAVVAIAPTLQQKAVICRNAIAVAHTLHIPEPKVAILSAIEDVDPAIPSTIDAAALCKMADRGQIAGGVLDGPLAMDNAINAAAAATKGIVSPVAGDADILIVPNLEAGNILYKNLTYLAGADAAGVIVGAAVPIVLASRSDSVRARMASTALASLLAPG